MEVGQGAQGQDPGDSTQPMVLCFTFQGGQMLYDTYPVGAQPDPGGGQPIDFPTAVQNLAEAYQDSQGNSSDDEDEASFQSGLGNASGNQTPDGTSPANSSGAPDGSGW